MKKLLKNENIVYVIPGLAVTNFRVIHYSSSSQVRYKQSILLKNITSCEVLLMRKTIYLYLGIIFAIATIAMYFYRPTELIFGAFPAFLSVLFLLLYFVNTTEFLIIKSANSYIKYPCSFDVGVEFIEHVDAGIINHISYIEA